MVIKAAISNGVEVIFNTLSDLVEVAIVERKRSTGSTEDNNPVVSDEYDPFGGYTSSARNTYDRQTGTIDRADDPSEFSAISDVTPFPTVRSPNPLQNSPLGVVRFAVDALVLTPKVTLMDAMKGGRVADFEALFEVKNLPMLDGRRFIPDGKDRLRIGDRIYTIMSSETDPTVSIVTAKLRSGYAAVDVTDG